MPEILVDILKAKDLYSGLGQFSVNFAEELQAHIPRDHRFTFLAPAGFSLPNEAHYDRPDLRKRYLPVFNKPYDLWHSLHQFPSFRPGPRSKWILTVHDLNFMLEKEPAKSKRYLARLQRNIDRADAITTISHFTRAELEQHLDLRGKNVTVIHNGVKVPAGKPSEHHGRPYFLSLGVFKEKKNFHALLPLMKHLPDHDLVLAGNNNKAYGERIKAQVKELGLGERIHLPGAVDEQEKFRLYSNCEGFLFPSLAEGFGLPVIEAMLLGKPVFLSRATSLPEIGGDVAFYFDAWEPEAMASIINEGLRVFNTDPRAFSEVLKRHAAQFSWEGCVEKYVALYADVLG